MTVDSATIGGLVLAGGRGTRMGGIDKGLLPWGDTTLAGHAVARLAPQVARVALSANRHPDLHAELGVPVVRDAAAPDGELPFDGPLAGVLAAFDVCEALHDSQWLAVVPCDVPRFPLDLVRRLADACGAEGRLAAHAVSRDPGTGDVQEQPLCCLLSRRLRGPLAGYLAAGRRSARGFLASAGAAAVPFWGEGDDPQAFVNANTGAALAAIDRSPGPPALPVDPCR